MITKSNFIKLISTLREHCDPLTKLEEDHPFSQTLRFVEVAEKVKDTAFKVEDLEYLLRHRFDETGKYRPNREGTLALLKTLSDGIRAIRSDNAIPVDPGAMGEDVLRQKLGLVLPPDVVERFLAMMNGTAEFTATKSPVALANQLKVEEFSDESAFREIVYSGARQEQKLTYRGVLLDPQAALQGASAARTIVAFESYCGGLVAPESDTNLWGYKFSWNPRNVILAGQGGSAKYIDQGITMYIPYHRLFQRTVQVKVPGFGMFDGSANRDSLKYRSHYGLDGIPTL